MGNPATISFIIPFISKTGGIAVVFEYYRELSARGHIVRLFYPLLPFQTLVPENTPFMKKLWVFQIRTFFANLWRMKRGVDWHRFPVPVTPVPWISGAFLPTADVVIATTWPTAFSVARLHPTKGKKFYFVQGYETWLGYRDKVDASYRLPLEIITIAPWLSRLMVKEFQHPVCAEVHNAVDANCFRTTGEKTWDHPSILMIYSPMPNKGCEEGLCAITKLIGHRSGIEVNIFGMHEFNPPLPGIHYHRDPSPQLRAALYAQATIFVWPSRKEGWGLPVMEAMSAQCAVIAARIGCVEVIYKGDNLTLFEVGDWNSIYTSLLRLVDDPTFTREIAEKGQASIQAYTWESSGAQFEKALLHPEP